jgi:Holliday junction resolvase
MNACQKGKRGEREFAAVLRDSFGLDARRGVQYQGSIDSPDVVGGWQGTHPEVKRVENLDINDAVQQAVRDAGVQIPYVAHRKNNCPWLITLRVQDLAAFVQRVKETLR